MAAEARVVAVVFFTIPNYYCHLASHHHTSSRNSSRSITAVVAHAAVMHVIELAAGVVQAAAVVMQAVVAVQAIVVVVAVVQAVVVLAKPQ